MAQLKIRMGVKRKIQEEIELLNEEVQRQQEVENLAAAVESEGDKVHLIPVRGGGG